jgi:hypothetical protein
MRKFVWILAIGLLLVMANVVPAFAATAGIIWGD